MRQADTPPGMPPSNLEQRIATRVLGWYGEHARDLPWRHSTTTPWGVLVSEVMLQQTPVVRVLPVWQTWMARWPTPMALAADVPGSAIREWGRLGYPRRALRLYECAVTLVRDHGGLVPSELSALRALPGVGEYTSRAVAAFAFDQRCAVVDTNVRRVVARAIGGRPDAGATTTVADLEATETLLPPDPPTAANVSAALMELGATRCTARTPDCGSCPIAGNCAWHASGQRVPDGPSRRPQRYAGTDRQARGTLLAMLRSTPKPVERAALDGTWADAAQRERALAGLVADGLVTIRHDGRYALRGE